MCNSCHIETVNIIDKMYGLGAIIASMMHAKTDLNGPSQFNGLDAFIRWSPKYPYMYHLDNKCIKDYLRFKPYHPAAICRQHTLVCKLMLTAVAGPNLYNNVGKWFGSPPLNGYRVRGGKWSCKPEMHVGVATHSFYISTIYIVALNRFIHCT